MTQKIALFCAGGFSTSLLVNKMREAAAAKGLDCDINAYAVAQIEEIGPSCDVMLIGPQVRYVVSKLQQEHPSWKVTDIPMRMYGTMDGKGTIELAEKLIGEE